MDRQGARGIRDRTNNRAYRAKQAEETLQVIEDGWYEYAHDQFCKRVELSNSVSSSVDGSFLLRESDALQDPNASHNHETSFEVTEETSLGALYRLASQSDWNPSKVILLNFASAKNPGGGFLKGSQAQEESLARSSALYPCLIKFIDQMYEQNRNDPRGCLYSDDMIVSPLVPFFRNDDGAFLETPVNCSVITAPAPNAGAAKAKALKLLRPVFQNRIRRLLRLAFSCSADTLILGAWGCGVFGNDPSEVASAFHEALLLPAFKGLFRNIVFAIPNTQMYSIFFDVFCSAQSTEMPDPTNTWDADPPAEQTAARRVITVDLISFSFLSGNGKPPADAEFSARDLPSPGGLVRKQMTGLDARCRKEVMSSNQAHDLLAQVQNFIIERGRNESCAHISVAIGCDHGKHRSVTICEELAIGLRSKSCSDFKFKLQTTHIALDTESSSKEKTQKAQTRRWARGFHHDEE
jgi:uncharacterized protein (TIGR02452 family)